jgi:hypothetical protein
VSVLVVYPPIAAQRRPSMSWLAPIGSGEGLQRELPRSDLPPTRASRVPTRSNPPPASTHGPTNTLAPTAPRRDRTNSCGRFRRMGEPNFPSERRLHAAAKEGTP